MAEGQLRCVGSPLFLKKAYGVGYQLTIEKSKRTEGGNLVGTAESEAKEEETEEGFAHPINHHEADEALQEIIRSAVPQATRLTNSSTEMRYQLPIAAASSFAPMFQNLDEAMEQGTICSYGVSVTTLVSTPDFIHLICLFS